MEYEDEVNKIKKVYKAYKENILDKELKYKDINIFPKLEPKFDGMCGTFMHTISKEYKQNQKFPCEDCINSIKCETLSKYNPLLLLIPPRHICRHRTYAIKFLYNLSEIEKMNYKIYEKIISKEKGRRHRIIILDDINNYVIILDKKHNYYNIWTAYPIGELRKRKFLKEYDLYVKQGTPLE